MTIKAKKSGRNQDAIWCDRRLLDCSFMGLCLTEPQFFAAMKKLGISREEAGRWTAGGDGARTHFLTHEKHGRVAIVCINHRPGRTRHQINALLVHEAVHIWQVECEYMDEKNPGQEVEAFAIQSIAQTLMGEYWKAHQR